MVRKVIKFRKNRKEKIGKYMTAETKKNRDCMVLLVFYSGFYKK